MVKARLASMVVGLVLLAGLVPGTAIGSESRAPASSGVTPEEIQAFVDGVYGGKISSPEVMAFHARLTQSEKETLLEKSAAKVGMSQKDLAALKRSASTGKPKAAPTLSPLGAASTSLPWSGSIVLASYDGYSERCFGSYWYADANADGDPSDMDYVDNIPCAWNDVSLLNWYSDDAIVLNGLMLAYGADLSGFSSSYDWMRLVIGDRAADLLCGGMDRVKNGLYLW